MKHYISFIAILFSLAFLSTGCNDNLEKQQAELKIQQEKYNDSVFQFLENNWNFVIPRATNELEKTISEWKSWNDMKKEFTLKPVSTIQAFQKKSEILSSNAISMQYQSFPAALDYPEVRARFTTLLNSIQMLEMYITQDPINTITVKKHINSIQSNIKVFYAIMEEELVRNKIPIEEGEVIMIHEMQMQALDATRNANPEE